MQSHLKLCFIYLVVFFVLTVSNYTISLISEKLVSCFIPFGFIYMYYAYILCLMLSFLLFVMYLRIYTAHYVFLAWRLVLFHWFMVCVRACFFDIRLYGKMPNFVFQGIFMLLWLHGVYVCKVFLFVLFMIWFFAKWVCFEIILLVFQMIIADFNQDGIDME